MSYKPKPGVADNKSYKDQYHFRNVTNPIEKDDLPSMDADPSINTTIKKNPYRSNVNIEEGELVLQPDLSALFKASGKKHSQGGIDVLLKPDSFVFSDDKTLAITPGEKKRFELKEGGKYSPTKNTPAEVVKKNVPIKHYNTLINNIQDVGKDNLARKSSAMMLEKYIETLGNVAYLQENKKDFPDGLPPFSAGTAPVYDPETKSEIMQSKQYAKYGGSIRSLPKAQIGLLATMRELNSYRNKNQKPNHAYDIPGATPSMGGVPSWFKLWTKSNTEAGHVTPTGADSRYNPATGNAIYDDYKYWKSLNDNKDFSSPSDYQTFVYNNIQKQDPTAIQGMWDKYGVTAAGLGRDCEKDGTCGFADSLFGARTASLSGWRPKNPPGPGGEECPCGMDHFGRCNDCNPESPADNPYIRPGEVNGPAQKGIEANWQFTPWQRINQGYDALQYATAKRYMPFRSHYNATYAEPSLLNPEQAIADTQASGNQQLSSLNSLSPILRNAQASSVYGQLLGSTPQIRSQYDNQNAQITNQFRLYNNQTKNDETLKNLGFDQQYYQQSVEGRKNFDNLRSALANQAMSNLNTQVEQNQALSYNLLTRPQPIYDYDWKTGNFTRKPGVDIRDIYNTSSEGSLQSMIGYAKMLKDQGFTPQEVSALLRSSALGKLAPYLGEAPTFGEMMGRRKKGGTIKKKNPYHY